MRVYIAAGKQAADKINEPLLIRRGARLYCVLCVCAHAMQGLGQRTVPDAADTARPPRGRLHLRGPALADPATGIRRLRPRVRPAERLLVVERGRAQSAGTALRAQRRQRDLPADGAGARQPPQSGVERQVLGKGLALFVLTQGFFVYLSFARLL